jgi:hypothetical protein
VAVHTCNPSYLGGRGRRTEFEAKIKIQTKVYGGFVRLKCKSMLSEALGSTTRTKKVHGIHDLVSFLGIRLVFSRQKLTYFLWVP